jgi:hypothetical protein
MQYDTGVLINGWRDLGREDLAVWVERTLARPFGCDLVARMIAHLGNEATKKAKTIERSVSAPAP